MVIHLFRREARSIALLRRLAFSALALLALGARAEPARSLTALDFVALEGDRVQLTMTLSAPPPQPAVFTVDKPARLSVDLADTTLALTDRYRKINVGLVRSVAAAEAKGRTRVVIELSELTPHTVRVEGNKVLVELAGAAHTLPSTSTAATPGSGPANAITAIDFRRGEKGEGRVLITLSDARGAVDVREEGGRIVARVRNATIPERLMKRLDVLDFATPVKYIDASRDAGGVQVAVTPIAVTDFEQVAYQAGNVFTLELQPLSQDKLEEKKRNEPQYTGEHISLSFQSVDIRSLLQIIADVAQVNMVVSDSVNGQIAMRLQNVPWDQALDIILRTKGLGQRRQGNVILVAPLDELAQREKAELEIDKQKVQLAPLRSELVQVNYAKASEVAALIKSKENSILSARGSVTVDERTNTLLVLETRDKMAEIRALVQKLDVPVRQVLIESRIVIASSNFDREFGVRFGVTAARATGNNGVVTTSGTGTATDATVSNVIGTGNNQNLAVGSLLDRYNVNLPTSSAAAGSLALAILSKNSLVDLELQALQSEGKGEVISSPRVITANGKEATIEQGKEIPYQQSASSGATSIQFKKAVLSLNVTPQITPDNRVIMDLAVTNDAIGQVVPTGNGGTAPAIDTRKVNTQVLVDNGQTVVLGGIYQQTSNDTLTKVPLLGDIPFLGALFRSTTKIANKTELLVFITPKILTEGLKVN